MDRKSRKEKIKLIQEALAGKMPKQYASILEVDEIEPGVYADDQGNRYNKTELDQKANELRQRYEVVIVEIGSYESIDEEIKTQ